MPSRRPLRLGGDHAIPGPSVEVEYQPDMEPMDHHVLYDFGGALQALRRGYSVARAAWRNPGKYVVMHSDEFYDPETGAPTTLKPHLIWKNDKGEFIPWTPSQDAVLAEDWFIGKSGEWDNRKAQS